MRRVRARIADLEVEFTDREVAVRQVEELAERGTWVVHVIYGPEGCGKTAFLRQSSAILEDHGYHVVYVDPLAERLGEVLQYTSSLRGVVKDVLKLFPEPYSRIVDVAINVAGKAMRSLSRPKIAVLMDDIFQAVGVDKAEQYVKALLNLIEWPPADYDKIVVLVASSEGVTRERVGRHRWATFRIMWNMPRGGFAQLYGLLPGERPPIDEVWRWTGGNPKALGELYVAGWRVEDVLNGIVRAKGLRSLAASLTAGEEGVLREAVEDPDTIFRRLREPEARSLEKKLVELNLIVEIWDRDGHGWIDVPPPERDPELGIGRYYAWQTPLHREAVRRTLGAVGR